jgi:NAD(P)-dependent dehydrogenase (short-subunit alcohol dehydrogenase family)
MAQTILVTGSSSGFGRRISETLAQQGHTVFASMRDIAGKNAAVAQELTTWAHQKQVLLHVLEVDVTDTVSVQAGVQQMLSQTGRIDVVVNNAGFMLIGLSEACTLEQLQQMYDVNLFGAFRVNQAVLPHMRQQKAGLLVYLSSAGASLVYPFMGAYGSSKAALASLAETFYYETYSLGIDTTIIQAGAYATELARNFQPAADVEKTASYGMAGYIAQEYIKGFPMALSAENAADPQGVADLIADLVQSPAGQRPLKVPIGPYTEGVTAMNQAIEPIQQQVLPGFGLEMLLKR